ncbi:hypothetical protein ACJW30_04G022000 [Castanea mollissima]
MDMETVPSSASVDLHTIRRRIREMAELHDDDVPDLTTTTSDSDEKLLRDFTLDFDNKVNQIVLDSTSHVASLTLQDFDAFFERLKEELNMVEAESTKISNEIEILARTNVEDSTQLKTCLERLECDLDSITSQGLEKVKAGANANCPTYGDDESSLINEPVDHKLELLELEVEIERNKTTLKSLQDLDHMYRWFDAIEQIEDLLTGLKVVAFTENCIRLSLQTYIPKLEGSRKIEGIEPSVLNHELLIEVLEGTMELKSVEIFPNDVYIIDILDAAKSLRFSLEYLDRDESIIAHMAGAVDAFIKISQDWPILSSPLKLISLKSSDHSKEISLTFLCKAEEVANSLDIHIRQDISSFVDAIEKILVEQMHLELHFDDSSKK